MGYDPVKRRVKKPWKSTLEMACRHCGCKAPYRLNAYLLDAPYRCGNCRASYISLLLSQSLWRPLDQKARTAHAAELLSIQNGGMDQVRNPFQAGNLAI
jgi:hypothetical protein